MKLSSLATTVAVYQIGSRIARGEPHLLESIGGALFVVGLIAAWEFSYVIDAASRPEQPQPERVDVPHEPDDLTRTRAYRAGRAVKRILARFARG